MFKLPHELSHAQAPLLEPLQAAIKSAGWQVSGSELTSFDSSALAFVLDLQRAAQGEGANLVIHNMPEKLVQLATLYGVNELISTKTKSAA
jgi:phospholipid transport system transporter-binding protein